MRNRTDSSWSRFTALSSCTLSTVLFLISSHVALSFQGVVTSTVDSSVLDVCLDTTNSAVSPLASPAGDILYLLSTSGVLTSANLSSLSIVRSVSLQNSPSISFHAHSKILHLAGRSYLIFWNGSLFLLDTIQNTISALPLFESIPGVTEDTTISDLCVCDDLVFLLYTYDWFLHFPEAPERATRC